MSKALHAHQEELSELEVARLRYENAKSHLQTTKKRFLKLARKTLARATAYMVENDIEDLAQFESDTSSQDSIDRVLKRHKK